MRRLPLPALTVLALAGCVPATTPPPSAPPPRPVPIPAPAPPPALSGDWSDWPVTPGDWAYSRDGRGSAARFGAPGSAPLVTLRCDSARRTVYLSMQGMPGDARITTTSMTRTVRLQPGEEASHVATALPARDGLLDAIAFSRGRFVVAPQSGRTLVLPPYAEVGRVIEDCRG